MSERMQFRHGCRWALRAVLAALLVMLCVPAAVLAANRRTAAAKWPAVTIRVLSGRANLVSGGSSLIGIDLSRPAALKRLTVTLAGHNVSGDFALHSGQIEGLVSGLSLGRNTLKAVFPDGSGAKLTLVDHPNGGPLFSGPQLQPWKCQAGARDAQCDQPPTYTYEYWSKNQSAFEPYDPANPPSDVATTTTQDGVTLPFVIRIETGYQDRNQYKVATLYQPGKPWSWSDPQRQWNHKLLLLHGAACGASYGTWGAPDVTNASLSEEGVQLSGDVASHALGLGYMTASTALDNSGYDCNVAVQAESLVMAKEHIVKTYGTLRFTIGEGCSGGSLAIQWVANAYPGIYQGILPTCSFPDAMTSATQVADYALLEHYWLQLQTNSATRGVVWSPTQFASVEGNALPVDAALSVGCLDPNPPYTSQSCPTGYFYGAVPYFPCPNLPAADEYNAQTNPAGDRCSIFDLNKNLLGLRRPSVWSPAEKEIGHGFTGLPIDNVGVEYGLQALQEAEITPGQFADLNAYIGGADTDLNPVPNRLVADQPALANAYRTGLINETNNLNQTAIIDCRGPDPGAAHDAYRAFAVRARLDREHGGHGNQLIWEGPAPIIADQQCEINAFDAMNRWLTAIANDHSSGSIAAKVVGDKPADLTDRCYDGRGDLLWGSLCGQTVVPVYGTARMVAGQPITTDQNKCQLKPLARSDITWTIAGVTMPVPFTDAEWAELQKAFPTGVCNFSKPGVSQQPTIPWQTYQRANGSVINGGQPMGGPPVATSIVPRRASRLRRAHRARAR
jgi:hypothetical protein